MHKLGLILTVAFGLASLANPALAGNTRRTMAQAITAKCKQAIDPKHLKGDALKAEWKKCREEGDSYQ